MFCSIPVRPTEIPEDNIFVCESKYIEGGNENTTRKIAKGFKPPPISSDTCPDEIYYFPKKISLKRVRKSIMVHCRDYCFRQLLPERQLLHYHFIFSFHEIVHLYF